MNQKIKNVWVKILLMICLMPMALAAQSTEKNRGQADGDNYQKINQESPRYFVLSLDKALRQNNLDTIGELLDLRHMANNLKKNYSLEMANKLKFIFDRKFVLDIQKYSNATLGNQKDGEPFYREKIYEFTEKKKKLVFYIDRIKTGRSHGAWLISPITIANINELYNAMEGSFFYRYLPHFLFEFRLLNLHLWKILLIFFYLLGIFIIVKLQGFIAAKLVSKHFYFDFEIQKEILIEKLPKMLSFFTFFILLSILVQNTEVTSAQLEMKEKYIRLILILSVYFPVLIIVDIFHEFLVLKNEEVLSAKKNKTSSTNQVYPFGKGVFKVFISSIFILIVLQNFGVDLTAIFAGLGVGGIAVAFAGQKTMENLIGGLSIIFDRPIKIGDFCKFDDKMGTVEEIGLRSTKIRTLDRTVITIPNAEFAQTKIENFKKRDRIRLHKIIAIRYETTPNQIRYLLLELKKYLLAHPKVDEDPCRIRFIDFNSYSIDIEIYAYVLTSDWSEFLGIREDIYLHFIKIIEDSGTEFAFPSQTLYLNRSEKLDVAKKQIVEEKIKKLKEEKKLYFPDFPEEYIREIWNTQVYPNLD